MKKCSLQLRSKNTNIMEVKETSDLEISSIGSEHFFFFFLVLANFRSIIRMSECGRKFEKADTEHILRQLKLCAFYTMLRSFYFHRQWEDF